MIHVYFEMQVGTGSRAEKIRTYNFKVFNIAFTIFLWDYYWDQFLEIVETTLYPNNM